MNDQGREVRTIDCPVLDGWQVTVDLHPDGTVSRFTLQAAGDGLASRDGITTRLLRSIRLGDVVATARKLDAQQPHDAPDTHSAETADFAARPGRAGRPDHEYAAIAAMYVGLLNDAETHPVKVLAKRLRAAPSQVRNILSEARRRELLTGGRPGVATGDLTARARALLADGQGT